MLTGSFAFTAVSVRRRGRRTLPVDPVPPAVSAVVTGVAGGIVVETLAPAPEALTVIATENGVMVHV